MSYTIVIDVGGTKTAGALISVIDQTIEKSINLATIPGLDEFPKFLAGLVREIIDWAKLNNKKINQTILISMPGNFEYKEKVICRAGSAKQIVKKNETVPVNSFMTWVSAYVESGYQLKIVNDGKAQALGAIYSSWIDAYNSKTFLYIGPGTGLGGAIIKINQNEPHYEFITDGHIFDILVEIENKKFMAEDILSGKGVFQHLGISAKELNKQYELQKKNTEYVSKMGDVCIKIINAIKTKTLTKKYGSWNKSELTSAANINYVILGGSIGTKGALGAYLKSKVEACGMPTIQSENTINNAYIGLLKYFEK